MVLFVLNLLQDLLATPTQFGAFRQRRDVLHRKNSSVLRKDAKRALELLLGARYELLAQGNDGPTECVPKILFHRIKALWIDE